MLAAAVVLFVRSRISVELDARTDLVGFPTYTGFNISRMIRSHYLLMIAFPVLSVLFYWGLTRLRRSGASSPPSEATPHADHATPAGGRPESVSEPSRLAVVARIAFVGFVLGCEVAAASGWMPWWTTVGVVTVSYATTASVVPVLRWGTRRGLRNVAAVNSLVVPFLILGAGVVASSTRVAIEGAGSVRSYVWLPAWLFVPAFIALETWVIWRLRADPMSWVKTEGLLLTRVAGAIGVFLLHSHLPGALGPMDLYHEGEPLVAGRLVAAGRIPWRDLFFVHGFLADVLRPWLGWAVFGDSRWGLAAADQLLLVPLYWVCVYELCAHLFRERWTYLLATQIGIIALLAASGDVSPPGWPASSRFLLMPICALLLVRVLRYPAPRWTVGLVLLLFIQAVLVPESGYYLVACALVVFAFELSKRERGAPLMSQFPRTAWGLLAGLVLGIAWCGILWAMGALGAYLEFHLDLMRAHSLIAGIPISGNGALFELQQWAPIVAVVGGGLYLGVCLSEERRRIALDDWVMASYMIFTAFYYFKFLARADAAHLHQVFTVCLPLMLYVVYRLARVGDALVARSKSLSWLRRAATTSCLLVAVVIAWGATGSALAEMPQDFRKAAPRPWNARLGFVERQADGGENLALSPLALDDLRHVIEAYAGARGRIFDFTNSPGLFEYLIPGDPVSPYYHVLLATRLKDQDALVESLERERPRLVIYESTMLGMSSWDGIANAVRHYEVSRYLLRAYRPLLRVHGYLFLISRAVKDVRDPNTLELSSPPITHDLDALESGCNWGLSPLFLDIGPQPGRSEDIPVDLPSLRTRVTGWAVDPESNEPATEVVVRVGGKEVGRGVTGVQRADVRDRLGAAAERSGFDMVLDVPVSEFKRLDVKAWALDAKGGRWPLRIEVGGGVIGETESTGRWLSDAAVPGAIDGLGAGYRVRLPRGAFRYGWLRLRTSGPGGGVVAVREEGAEAGITFRTGRGVRSYVLSVGSCPQWKGNSGVDVEVGVDPTVEVTQMSLVR